MSHRAIFTAQIVGAGESADSGEIMLGHDERKHSLYYAITGDGTAKIEYLASPDGVSYVLISTAIATNKTKSTGEQSDGVHFDELDMIPCETVKFRVTETGSTSGIVVTAKLCYRLWD